MNKISTFFAACLFFIAFVLMFLSSYHDSVIFDETAHIGAGYSYLTQFDMRLNPEHPPLFKDIAALPLLGMDLNFPTDHDAWKNQVNGQWDMGGGLLFEFGNDAESILHRARLPIMLLSILTGFLFFFWARKHFGNRVALLSAFFYAFSPTIIAHSRFVTTDIAAALGFLIGISTFIDFLERPTRKRLLIAGVAFGIAQSLKFSLFLLVPLFIIFVIFWAYANRFSAKEWIRVFAKTGIVFLIGGLVVWLVYIPHVWNYPQAKQWEDAKTIIGNFGVPQFVTLDLWLIEHNITRPLGQYLMGVMMVTQRTAGGNSAFFLGEVSSEGWIHYFPTVYLLKENLGFHLLTFLALFVGIRRFGRRTKSMRDMMREHFALSASLVFVIFYWLLSINNPLNIGVRHVLPVLPFTFILVSHELVYWIRGGHEKRNGGLLGVLYNLYLTFIKPTGKTIFLVLILLWITLASLFAFPHYLSYYNELVGGTKNGYRYATDSNYDWGQDLKRLAQKLEKDYPNEKVYLHYFGGSSWNNGAQRYWLGEKFVPHYSSFGPPPRGSLFAISVNELMGNWAIPVKGFPEHKPENTYSWLRALEPTSRGGISIFIYRIP